MKTTKKQFEYFKKCCKKYIDKFHLGYWEVDYYLQKLDNADGRISANYIACRVSIFLDTSIVLTNNDTIEEVIEYTAQHEVLHLLFSNISALARSRYATEDEINKTEEELVVKVQHILKELI